MPLISSPLDLWIVLIALIVAGIATALEQNQETGLLTVGAFFAQFFAVLWIWKSFPFLILLGALTFCVAFSLARPQGTAKCWAFGSAFLIMANVMPIALIMPSTWMMALSIAALTGLALSIGPWRAGHVFAGLFAAFWSFGMIGVLA